MSVRSVKKDMRLVERKGTIDGFEWRCRVQSKENPHFVCRSVRKGTWFSDSRLSICVILRLTRLTNFLGIPSSTLLQTASSYQGCLKFDERSREKKLLTYVLPCIPKTSFNQHVAPIWAHAAKVHINQSEVSQSIILRQILKAR
ncbi:uncharacterized protein TNCV_3428061 [Trichonephila clavipes]|nr:uncharacterized protein TNCV_3428061 [Trichonephila clavipes]